jgi:superfamily II DNA/RNA helicase
VIAPGRELGSQIYAVAEALTQGTGIRSQMLIGGANVNRQVCVCIYYCIYPSISYTLN